MRPPLSSPLFLLSRVLLSSYFHIQYAIHTQLLKAFIHTLALYFVLNCFFLHSSFFSWAPRPHFGLRQRTRKWWLSIESVWDRFPSYYQQLTFFFTSTLDNNEQFGLIFVTCKVCTERLRKSVSASDNDNIRWGAEQACYHVKQHVSSSQASPVYAKRYYFVVNILMKQVYTRSPAY